MAYKSKLTWADVTPRADYLNRRQIMAGAGALALGAIAAPARAETLEPNSYEDITSYNNYYEFGTGKDDPARNAHTLTTDPWSVTIDGPTMNLLGVKLPEDDPDADSAEERSVDRIRGFLEVQEIVGALYRVFLEQRLAPDYLDRGATAQAQWMASR